MFWLYHIYGKMVSELNIQLGILLSIETHAIQLSYSQETIWLFKSLHITLNIKPKNWGWNIKKQKPINGTLCIKHLVTSVKSTNNHRLDWIAFEFQSEYCKLSPLVKKSVDASGARAG